ncbi:MAG: hypothetical protein GVY05_10805 [Bacteroidetes bacterium]|jgi:hypothetical protein|nr:hypothetical protein [Bacteroidota bacterium]
MSKLSLEALSQRADQVATEDLLNAITGGTENSCHPAPSELEEAQKENDAINKVDEHRKPETLN